MSKRRRFGGIVNEVTGYQCKCTSTSVNKSSKGILNNGVHHLQIIYDITFSNGIAYSECNPFLMLGGIMINAAPIFAPLRHFMANCVYCIFYDCLPFSPPRFQIFKQSKEIQIETINLLTNQ